MTNKYLIRLDDACPTMNIAKWQRIFDILDHYGVCPMVGIIPHNEDSEQMIDAPDAEFWDEAKRWVEKGYAIAMHGYNHCYQTDKGLDGLNPLWRRSEFAGVPLEVQRQKIADGYKIFLNNGVKPRYFFAPSHTFDENTLVALRECTDIRIISDTIALRPYRLDDFVFIPQLGGHCMEMMIPGIWTSCLHPSMMHEVQFSAVERFLERHNHQFVAFDDLDVNGAKSKDIFSQMLSGLYFAYRRLRMLR